MNKKDLRFNQIIHQSATFAISRPVRFKSRIAQPQTVAIHLYKYIKVTKSRTNLYVLLIPVKTSRWHNFYLLSYCFIYPEQALSFLAKSGETL